MGTLSFLDNFKKSLSKSSTIDVGVMSADEWITTGNYALNRGLSGDFEKGIPLGRISVFVGPSGSGKSFITSNIMVHAQKKGFVILVMDSENALDMEYLNKIGVRTDTDDFIYTQVTTIQDVNKVMSEFISGYIKAYGKNNPDSPRVLVVLDSLAMLASATELENYDTSGVVKGDQGQLAKQRKAMLKMITGSIRRLPFACVMTDHVYPQDIMLGDGAWAVTNSLKFCTSIIGLITKLKLKDGKEVTGVRMRFETYKSRFAKLGTKVELEVPYNKGMSSFSGLVDLLEEMKVVRDSTVPGKKQGWKVSDIDGEEFFFKPAEMTHADAKKLFTHPNAIPVLARDEEPELELDDDISEIE